MVKRLRLNDKTVREQIPEEDRDYQVFDTEIRGLSIRILRSGARSFVLDYRYAGRQRRMAIGRWPEWSVMAARERARELRRQIDSGCDPLGERGELREAPRIKDMIDRYLAEHVPHLSSVNAADQRAMLTKLVAPHWANALVTEITPHDVAKLLNIIAEGRARPSKANPNNRARKLQGAKPTPEDAGSPTAGGGAIAYSSGGFAQGPAAAKLRTVGKLLDVSLRIADHGTQCSERPVSTLACRGDNAGLVQNIR